MKRIKRKKRPGAKNIWEVGSLDLPSEVDEAQIFAAILIGEQSSGEVMGQDITARPSLPQEVRAFVEQAFRNMPLKRRPGVIRVVGREIFEELQRSSIFVGTRLVREKKPIVLPAAAAGMKQAGLKISEGSLLGVRHRKKAIAEEVRGIWQLSPWGGIRDVEPLVMSGEGITYPVVTFTQVRELTGMTFFRSGEDERRFEIIGQKRGQLTEKEVFAVAHLSVWIEGEEAIGDVAAEAARRQGLSLSDDRFFEIIRVRSGVVNAEIIEVEEAEELLRHLQALRRLLEKMQSVDEDWKSNEKLAVETTMDDGSKIGIEPQVRKPIKILRMHISIDDIQPPIWRRVELPDHLTLAEAHEIIQVLMGWEDCHIWEFSRGDTIFSTGEIWGNKKSGGDPFYMTLHDVLGSHGKKLTYRYDFGDDWKITMRVESRLEPDEEVNLPRVIAGERVGPPEDSGGPWHYQDRVDRGEFDHDTEYFDLDDYRFVSSAQRELAPAVSIDDMVETLKSVTMTLLFHPDQPWRHLKNQTLDDRVAINRCIDALEVAEPFWEPVLQLLRDLWKWQHPDMALSALRNLPTLPQEPTLHRVLKRVSVDLLDTAAEAAGVDFDALTRRPEREQFLYRRLTTRDYVLELVSKLDPASRELLARLSLRDEPWSLEELFQSEGVREPLSQLRFVLFGSLRRLRDKGLIFMGIRRENGKSVRKVTIPLEVREILAAGVRQAPPPN